MCLTGDFRCTGANLEKCGADNASWDLVMTCASAAICDAVSGKCGNQLCTTGQYRCTGDILEKCNSGGTAWETVQACAAGLCDPVGKQCDACTPNTSTCFNATTRLTCSADGQALNAIPCTPPTGSCSNGQCMACTPTSADYTSRVLDMYTTRGQNLRQEPLGGMGKPEDRPAPGNRKACPCEVYVMAERSRSMSGTPWTNQSVALNGFFQDAASAGLGVALRYFPLDDTCGPQQGTCSGASYATPLVPWGVLPNQAPTLQSSINSTQPNGCFTPTQEALNGVLAGAKARQLAQPNHVVVAVILSDGEPCCGDCPVETDTGLGAIAAGYYGGTPSIRTFTIAVAPAADNVLSVIAQNGGGQSYSTAGTSTQIQSALTDIRDAAGPCVFDIPLPDGGVVDPNAVTVGYVAPGSSTSAPLAKVASKAACTGDGWYFNDNASPTKVMLCPNSCAAVRVNLGAKIRVSVGTCP